MGNQAYQVNRTPGNDDFIQVHSRLRMLSKSNEGGGSYMEEPDGRAPREEFKNSFKLVEKQQNSGGSLKRMREDSVDLLDLDSVKLTGAEGHQSRQGSKKIACGSVGKENENVIFNSSERNAESSNFLDVAVFISFPETDGHHSRQGSTKSGQQSRQGSNKSGQQSRQGSNKMHRVMAFRRQTFNRRGFRRKTKYAPKVSQNLDTLTVDGNEGNHNRHGSQKSNHEEFLQRGLQQKCKHCADVTDSTNWMKTKPLISTEAGFPMFVQTCGSGRFECTQTGIRWVSHTDMKIQYHAVDWELLAGQMESYEPAGPLLNFTLLEGEMEEIHLPHFLCLGGAEASLHDSVQVLHWRESRVSLEKCTLTRFHCKLSKPTFSGLGVIMKLIKSFWPVHVILVHYCAEISPLIFHSYLMPDEKDLLKRVVESNTDKHQIQLPKPEETLMLGANYQLKTSCASQITPPKIQLRYPNTVPNFFKVRIEQPADRFKMELVCVDAGECKWIGEFYKEDYCKTRAKRHVEALDSCSAAKIENEAQFIDDHRARLIELVKCVAPIAEEMRSQGLIHDEKYSNIMAAKTSENKMREIYECLQSSGIRGKTQFYQILRQKEPYLVNDLGSSHP